MPRDGSGIYSKPFLNVVEGTTIESAVHNGTISDIETDLNAPRPIVAGGTGATSAAAARDNLDAEVAGKEVTNYDTHVWENGSFWSQGSASGSPVGGRGFSGICCMWNNLQGALFVLVRDLNDTVQPGRLWARQKLSGAWTGPWAIQDAVAKTGDTMTGPLIVNGGITCSTNITTDTLTASGDITTDAITATGPVLTATGFTCSSAVTGARFGMWSSGGGTWMGQGTMLPGGTPDVELTRLATTVFQVLGSVIPYRPGGGPWVDSSDARIKNVVGDYASGLDAIKTLNPVRFTYKGNDTTSALANKSAAMPYADSPHNGVATTNKEFIGLIAQDVENTFPETVTQHAGYIDGQAVSDIRTLDSGPLLFALINAVKELSARLEALEGAGAARGR